MDIRKTQYHCFSIRQKQAIPSFYCFAGGFPSIGGISGKTSSALMKARGSRSSFDGVSSALAGEEVPAPRSPEGEVGGGDEGDEGDESNEGFWGAEREGAGGVGGNVSTGGVDGAGRVCGAASVGSAGAAF